MTNMDFYVTPVLNIDGYIYTWENTTVGSSSFMDVYQITFEGSYSQSHRWKRDEIIKAYNISKLIFPVQEMDNIQTHFHLKQPFTNPIFHYYSLNDRKQWTEIADESVLFRIGCGGRTGHQDLQTAAVMALISTATLMPTGGVSLVFLLLFV